MHRYYFYLVSFLVIILINACSSGSALGTQELVENGVFNLGVLSDSKFASNADSSFRLEVNVKGNETELLVIADGVTGLKALYFDIDYDANRFTPVSIDATDLLEDDQQEILQISYLEDAGIAHYGFSVVHPDITVGIDANGVIARAVFMNEPARFSKRISSVPMSEKSRPKMGKELSWEPQNPGDFDGNGLVNAGDLTQLAVHWGEGDARTTNTSYYWFYGFLRADGNQDGWVTAEDLAVIGQNWGNSILGGANIYRGNYDDYPNGLTDENGPGAELLGNVPYPGSLKKNTMGFSIEDHQQGDFYWVRQVDQYGNEGPAGQLIADPKSWAPRSDESRSNLEYSDVSNKLIWRHQIQGDSNCDGGVLVSDMTIIGVMQGQTIGNSSNGWMFHADVDRNGVLNLRDCEPIFRCYDQLITSYCIYHSTSLDDYPKANDQKTSWDNRLAHIEYRGSISQTLDRTRMQYAFYQTSPNGYYWVRPVDRDGNEGTPSNWVYID